jgi:hypothetical protein
MCVALAYGSAPLASWCQYLHQVVLKHDKTVMADGTLLSQWAVQVVTYM